MSKSQESPVIAHDDDGKPITEQDLVTESYQKPLQNSLANLVPSFAFEGTEAPRRIGNSSSSSKPCEHDGERRKLERAPRR